MRGLRRVSYALSALVLVLALGAWSVPAVFATGQGRYAWTDNGAVDPGIQYWNQAAVSDDGTRIAALTDGDSGTEYKQVWTSSNSGETWTAHPSTSVYEFSSIATSGDGSKLVAASWNTGALHTSNDYGATWTDRTAWPESVYVYTATSAANGQRLTATGWDNDAQEILFYTSSNAGASWTQQTIPETYYGFEVYASSTGQKLAALSLQSEDSQMTYVSNNYGVDWELMDTSEFWDYFTISGDGTQMAGITRQGSNDLDDRVVYIYTESGDEWVEQESLGESDWDTITSTYDGTFAVHDDAGYDVYTTSDAGETWNDHYGSGYPSLDHLQYSSDGSLLLSLGDSGYIYTSDDNADSFEKQQTEGFQNWEDIAVSASGQHMVAVGQEDGLYTSSDYGVTWVHRAASGQYWRAVAMSADGSRAVAVSQHGDIATSSNYGATWADAEGQDTSFQAVASSADGSFVVALDRYGIVYTSTDYGATIEAHEIDEDIITNDIAVSADGSRLVAATQDGVYTSSNYGVDWTLQEDAPSNDWNSVASSSDGSRLVIVGDSTHVFTSEDYGVTWEFQIGGTNASWSGITSSSDGKHIAISAWGGIMTSNDYGVIWDWEDIETENENWSSIAMSADGERIASTYSGGGIWTGIANFTGDEDEGEGETESTIPNNGDANGDGIQDSLQAHVSGLFSPVNGKYVVLEVEDGCTIPSNAILAESALAAQDPGYMYPAGLLDFNVATCGPNGFTTVVNQYYYGITDSSLSLRKFNSVTNTYAAVAGSSVSTITIGGQQVFKVSYSVTDGGELDEDGTANGVIVDPAGLASAIGAPNTGLGGRR